MKSAFLKTCGILLCLLSAAVFGLLAYGGLFELPGSILLTGTEQRELTLKLPVDVSVSEGDVSVLRINGERLSDVTRVSDGMRVSSDGTGSARIDISFAGIPIRSIDVTSVERRVLIPGGDPVGVTLFTRGALIVGLSDITAEGGRVTNPAREAGLAAGDVILSVDGTQIDDAAHLLRLIEGMSGDSMEMSVSRGGVTSTHTVHPVRDTYDGKHRLGVWVRDSTAGVGTLTYVDPSNDSFAGLGHAVTDIDTGEMLSIKSGEILASDIVEIKKGYAGIPGELRGAFSLLSDRLGSILRNTELGVYGKLYDDRFSSREPVEAALRNEVECGPAELLCTLSGEGVRSYDCEIIKLNEQSYAAQKGMVIRITDSELLSRTGGIVQGMSGSPLMQNGRIVGAVTHVFLNAPDRGYAIYIDWMLEISDNIDEY